MSNMEEDKQKIKVRVGKAKVVSRTSGSMDMVSSRSKSEEETVEVETQKKPKKKWFAKKVKKQKPQKFQEEPEQENKKASWCDWGIRIVLHLALIGIPLFFAPFTFEAFELNKQTLLYALALVALLLWLIKIMIEKRVTLVKTFTAVPVIVFLGVSLVATLLSQDMFSSFFGFYGRFSGGFVQMAALAVLFFVAVNAIKTLQRVKEYLYSFVFVYLVVLIIGFLQLFGTYIFPWDFTKITSFGPLGGSVTMLSVFLAAGMGVVITVMLLEGGWRRFCSAIIALAGLVQLMMLDVSIGWIALIAAMVMVFAVVVMRMEQLNGKGASWFPLIFLAIGVALMLIPVQGLFGIDFPSEISLGRPVSWDVTKAVLSDSPILGSGPETFFYDFAENRPVQFNDSVLWNMRFDKAGTQVLNDLSGMGILGGLALLAVVLSVAVETLRTLMKTKAKEQWLLILAPFSLWVSLIVTSFFFFFNTSLMTISWLMMGFTIAAVIAVRKQVGEKSSRQWSFGSSPQVALITSFLVLLVLIGGIAAGYYAGRMYMADVYYKNSQEKMLVDKDLNGATDNVLQAARLNPQRSIYHRGASQVFMAAANVEAAKEDPDVNVVSNNVGLAIEAGRTAVAVTQNNSAEWEILAGLYQNAGLYVVGTDEWVIDAYEKAIELDPNNPALYSGLGKAYVIKSDRILVMAAREQANTTGETADKVEISQEKRNESEEALNTAVEKFRKAIELKADYFDAFLSLGQTYDRKGDYEQAIEAMLVAVQYEPQNPDVRYELGRIFYNDKQYDKAEIVFNDAIELFADHSNSLYSLGLVYIQQDKTGEALDVFKRVLELNPDNEDVQKKIDELEGRQTPDTEETISSDLEEDIQTETDNEVIDSGIEVEDVVENVEN